MTERAAPTLRLHAVLPRSRANGPGWRYGVWFQGCTRACPGCCNPQAQGPEPRLRWSVARLVREIRATTPPVDGVTFTGGEPLEQAEALRATLEALREATDLSLLLFTGFTEERLARLPRSAEILSRLDVLVAGPYDRRQPLGAGLRASANQTVRCLTPRHPPSEIEQTPTQEVLIRPDGQVVITGVGGLRLAAPSVSPAPGFP